MSMTPLDGMKAALAATLQGIERYNPDNIPKLERYIDEQVSENGYDLEANLALMKLYQFNHNLMNLSYICKILLKALTNLPHSDFVICKSLLQLDIHEDPNIQSILVLHELLETCQFKTFWVKVHSMPEIVRNISGFEDSIRKYVCHVVAITYQHVSEERLFEFLGLTDESAVSQWINKNGWKVIDNGNVLITAQEETIKTKKITEKIDLETVAGILASCI